MALWPGYAYFRVTRGWHMNLWTVRRVPSLFTKLVLWRNLSLLYWLLLRLHGSETLRTRCWQCVVVVTSCVISVFGFDCCYRTARHKTYRQYTSAQRPVFLNLILYKSLRSRSHFKLETFSIKNSPKCHLHRIKFACNENEAVRKFRFVKLV